MYLSVLCFAIDRLSVADPVFEVRCVASRESISRVLTGMTPEQWNQMMADNDWNEVELRDSRYNQVVHMVSIADASTGRRRHFSSHEGMDLSTARQLDLAISQVCVSNWCRWPVTVICFCEG